MMTLPENVGGPSMLNIVPNLSQQGLVLLGSHVPLTADHCYLDKMNTNLFLRFRPESAEIA